jgi:hypothetical protein
MIVLVQGEDGFEGFMAIQANIIINGHGEPPVGNPAGRIVTPRGLLIADF